MYVKLKAGLAVIKCFFMTFFFQNFDLTHKSKEKECYTLPTDEILSGKNVRAWVSMILYLEN
jgi:hypothetical protein